MKTSAKYLCIFVLCLLVPFLNKAQDKIETDRPDQSENTHIINPNEFQVETGILVNGYKEGDASLIGSALVRYGLAKRVELRLLVEEGKRSLTYFQETAQGRFPIALSAKVALVEDDRVLPDITLVSFLNLPVISHPDENTHWAPAFIMALEKEVSKVTLTGNGGVQWDAFQPGHSYQGTGGISYEVGTNWKLFGEYYGRYENGKIPLHNLDAGLLYTLNNNVQLDLAYGRSIHAELPNSFITLGISFKLADK
jgi:hypothetical protein